MTSAAILIALVHLGALSLAASAATLGV